MAIISKRQVVQRKYCFSSLGKLFSVYNHFGHHHINHQVAFVPGHTQNLLKPMGRWSKSWTPRGTDGTERGKDVTGRGEGVRRLL